MKVEILSEEILKQVFLYKWSSNLFKFMDRLNIKLNLKKVVHQATFWMTTTFLAPNGDAYFIPTSLKIFLGTPRFAMYNFAEDRY